VTRHALWLVVLVKFVTPPLVVWPWSVPDVFGVAIERRALPEIRGPEPDPGPAEAGPYVTVPAGDASDLATRTNVPARAIGDALTLLAPWVLPLWIAGTCCLLGVEGVRIARLARRVRAARPADTDLERRLAEVAAAVGVAPVRVVAVAGIGFPAVWSLGRPVLLWPQQLREASPPARDALLIHELAHIKRRDHLVGWIELAAGLVWWWNPLFWQVRSSLREQAELACDAWVVATLPNGRRAYAESLLALSSAVATPLPSSSIAVIGHHATRRRVLHRRLVMIMKGRAPLRLSLRGLVGIALVAAATLPAWAMAASQQPPSSPPSATAPAVPRVAPATPAPVPSTAVPDAPTAQKPAQPLRQKPILSPAQAPAAAPVPVPAPPKPPPATVQHYLSYFQHGSGALPTDGRQLVEEFDKERLAIQQEADRRVNARRETVVKALEALQMEYAKAGKLDEAVAIRDYLRAGGPPSREPLLYDLSHAIRGKR
jgi:beta-lactamase regulating signal transducer with metallopeptidase domain